MNLLITGGFGYLGGRLAQFLAAQERHEVTLGTRRQAGPPPRWLPRAKAAQIHWNSPAELERICAGVDGVVHAAGMNARNCAADPAAALDFNGVATARLLRAAIRQKVRRFIYLSTAHVYGSPLAGTITEETCPVSLHPYATSHRAGEDLVRAARRNGEIEGVVIRLSNAYGAPVHQDVDCWTLLVSDLCRQAVVSRRMVLRSSSLQRRDFIAMTDACRAIGHLLELPADKLGDGLFNVGGGWAPTIGEMTQRIGERIHVAMGQMPEILRKGDLGPGLPEPLDYGTEKLGGTGFQASGIDDVDKEIDGLVRFCRFNLTAPS